MSKQVRILTSSSITVGRVSAILEENNISTMIIDNTESARLAGFGSQQNDVDLLVNESDEEAAKKILQSIEDSQ